MGYEISDLTSFVRSRNGLSDIFAKIFFDNNVK